MSRLFTSDGLPVVSKKSIDKHKREGLEWPISEIKHLEYITFLGSGIIIPSEDLMADAALRISLEAVTTAFYDVFKLLWLEDPFHTPLVLSRKVVEIFERDYLPNPGREYEKLFGENRNLALFPAGRLDSIKNHKREKEHEIYIGSFGMAYILAALQSNISRD